MSEVTYGETAPQTAVPIGAAAIRLGVSVDTLRRWANEGKITSFRTPGGQRRFTPEEIERVRGGESE